MSTAAIASPTTTESAATASPGTAESVASARTLETIRAIDDFYRQRRRTVPPDRRGAWGSPDCDFDILYALVQRGWSHPKAAGRARVLVEADGALRPSSAWWPRASSSHARRHAPALMRAYLTDRGRALCESQHPRRAGRRACRAVADLLRRRAAGDFVGALNRYADALGREPDGPHLPLAAQRSGPHRPPDARRRVASATAAGEASLPRTRQGRKARSPQPPPPRPPERSRKVFPCQSICRNISPPALSYGSRCPPSP